MERRKDIRAAIHGLLSPTTRDSSHTEDDRPLAIAIPESARESSLNLGGIYDEIQAELREHGVNSDPQEIAKALLQALSERPALCRGLFALYMLEER